MTETSPVASIGVPRAALRRRRRRGRAGRPARRAPGIAVPRRRAPDRRRRTPARRCRGTTRPPASCRSAGPWIAQRLLQRRARRRARSPTDGWLRTGDVAAIDRVRLHPPRRPHQGPDQVRRRVDQLGRARERDHGPPEGRRGRGHRHPAPEVGRAAAGLRRASRTGETLTAGRGPRVPRGRGWPSGGCPTTSCSSTRCRRRASASSRRRRSARSSPGTRRPADPAETGLHQRKQQRPTTAPSVGVRGRPSQCGGVRGTKTEQDAAAIAPLWTLSSHPDCAGQPGCTRPNQPEWCFRNASVRSLNSLTFS